MEAVAEKECKICGSRDVRPERFLCDVCLGFVAKTEEAQLGRPKKQKPQEVEVQTVEQEAPEPTKLDLRVCDDCKEEFVPYRRGCALMTHVCSSCLKTRMSDFGAKKSSLTKAIRDGMGRGLIILDMRKFEPELRTLTSVAAEQFRTVSAQALWMLLECLRGSVTEEAG